VTAARPARAPGHHPADSNGAGPGRAGSDGTAHAAGYDGRKTW
jgi:hypothetical protein